MISHAMKRYFVQSSSILLVTFSGAASAALTVSFEDVAESTTGSGIVSNGYSFAGNFKGNLYFTNGAGCFPVCAANGTRTLLAAGPLAGGWANEVTMTRSGGGTFALTGFDAGEAFSGGFPEFSAIEVRYNGFLAGSGVMSGSITLDGIVDGPGGLSDFQTFNVGGGLVDTIVFTGFGGDNDKNGFSLDNLNVRESAVPEPISLALLGMGLVGLVATRRRKQKLVS